MAALARVSRSNVAWLAASLLLVVAADRCVAARFTFGGSWENALSVSGYRSGVAVLDDNRFRLEAELVPANRFRLVGAVWIQTYHGYTELSLLDAIPEGLIDSVPPELLQSAAVRLDQQLILDRLHASARGKWFSLRIGRQPMAWGVGYIWNPTELIPAKSFLRPEYERPGQDAIRAVLDLQSVACQLYVKPGDNLPGASYVARLVGNVPPFDWGITAYRSDERDQAGVSVASESFLGGQFKGEALGVGVWAEGGYGWPSEERDWYRVCGGADCTLPTRTYVLAEYLRNSPGAGRRCGYPFSRWLGYLLNGVTLGRDYLAVSAMQPIFGFHSVGFALVANLNDLSAVLIPRASINLLDNLDLELYFLVPFGKSVTEYGAPGVYSGTARFSFYF